MKKNGLQLMASAVAAFLSLNVAANISSLHASAYLTITPTKYIGFVNYNLNSSTGDLYYLSYVRAAQSYDSRYITSNGVVSGPWASSSPTATTVADESSVWNTVLPFANFSKNTSSLDFTNIYRMKYTRSDTALSVSAELQDPIIVLAKVNGSQQDASSFDTYFTCGTVAIGDTDSNGYIDANDLSRLRLIYYGTATNVTSEQYVAADVNLDGEIDQSDITKLTNVLNGIGNFW